jgi:hypothetical protein
MKNNNSLLAYLLKLNNNNNIINKNTKHEGNTTQIVYNKEKWKKFRHILEFQGTNTNRLFWCIVETVLAEYDQRKFSLDKYLEEPELLLPNIDTEPEKVLKYLETLPMEKKKEFEDKFTRNLIYVKALTQGEITLENYPYLWRKYH